MAIELVKCLCESLLCFLIGLHDYCLEIDWEAVPIYTHTPQVRGAHTEEVIYSVLHLRTDSVNTLRAFRWIQAEKD